jgi:hypothetical protein
MADRIQLTSEVKTLLKNLSRQPTSSIHLMWAWFGAGKTHTLKHIEYLCKNDFTSIIPIYVEFPKSSKNFLDVYRLFITAINHEVVENAYYEVFTSSTKDKILKELNTDFYDLSNALKFLYQGRPQEQEIAIRWLRTDYKEKQILKNIGVVKPIQTAEDAMKVISWIVRLINMGNLASGKIQRVFWMIDEFQRIKDLRKPVIDEINSCLHSVFNRCPNGLSIIISFSGYPDKKLPEWLSPEIKDRLDRRHLLLPPLSKDEALTFIKDVLKHFRNPLSDIFDEYFPFNYESIYTIIKIIEDKAKKQKRHDEPKPRTIMRSFHMVLQEADLLIESGELKKIDSEFASHALEGISLTEED